MRNLSNRAESDGESVSSWEDGDIKETAGANFYKSLIARANGISLLQIFKHYNLRIDAENRKCTCPFSFHKNGKESTSSFLYYPQTNTFWCFGCKSGVSPCDFVSLMDGTTKIKAANKILNQFSLNAELNIKLSDDFVEKLNIMLDFSKFIRNIKLKFSDKESLIVIDNVCEAYDKLNIKFKLTNIALKSISDSLKLKLNSYFKI
jgi:hypothetical protein